MFLPPHQHNIFHNGFTRQSELGKSSPCRHLLIETRILKSWSISTIRQCMAQLRALVMLKLRFFPVFCVFCPRSQYFYIYFNSSRKNTKRLFPPPIFAGRCKSTCFLANWTMHSSIFLCIDADAI